MTAAAKMLASILAAASFTLQGCFIADFPWSAKIMIAEKCHKAAEELNAKDEMKAVHVKSCDEMDADKLQEYNITDCNTMVQHMLHFAIAVECQAIVAQNVAVKCGGSPIAFGDENASSASSEGDSNEKQGNEDDAGGDSSEEEGEQVEEDEEEEDDEEQQQQQEEARRLTSDDTDNDSEAEKPAFDAKACKAAIGDEVSSFEPKNIEEELAQQQAQKEEENEEAFLALTAECHKAVLQIIQNHAAKQFLDNVCTEVTDETKMADMGLSDDDCSKYFVQQYTDTGVVACIFMTLDRDDLPDPEGVTLDQIKTAAKDFGEQVEELPTIEEVQVFIGELMEDMLGGMEQEERLRLFQTMRKGQWPGRISRGGRSSSVGALAAASALALGALTCASWRLRRSRQEISEDEIMPIMAGEAEEPMRESPA